MKETESFEEWLETRPESVQKLAKEYPPGEYIIKPGAPYGVSNPGTIVEVYSYLENGDLGVIVRANNKNKDAIAHEDRLCDEYGKTEEERKKAHESDTLVWIDPKWMSIISN